MEGKCAINKKHVSLRIDYMDDEAKDLLPRYRKVTLGDILSIPYSTYDDGWGNTREINLWNRDSEQREKSFVLRNEHGKISATPSPLNFEKEGGKNTVKLDINTYNYGGLADDDYKDWLTVAKGRGNTLEVTATESKTNRARTGILYAWATDVKAAADAVEKQQDISYVEGGLSQSDYVAITVSQASRNRSTTARCKPPPIGYTTAARPSETPTSTGRRLSTTPKSP